MTQPPEGAAPPLTAFFSYARADAPVVRQFADQLRRANTRVLLDTEFLRPGEQFEKVILDMVRAADALVVFVSRASMQSTWVAAEVIAFSRASGKIIIPILINGAEYRDLPGELARYYSLLVRDASEIPEAARRVANALQEQVTSLRADSLGQFSAEAERRGAGLAASIAADIRAPLVSLQRAANSVFLVHGHDHEFRDQVDAYLKKLGIAPVILSKVPGRERSLLDKFEALAGEARFAVVLMSPDDLGASCRQYGHRLGGEHALRYRARQNVILELGFFYGRLGWDHVLVIQKPPEEPLPEFEIPSDLAGAVILGTSADVDWRDELPARLREAGLLTDE